MSPASSPSWASRPPKPTTGGCSPSCTTCDPDGFFLLAAPGPADVRDVAVCFQGFPEPCVLHAEALDLSCGEPEIAGQYAIGAAEPGVAGDQDFASDPPANSPRRAPNTSSNSAARRGTPQRSCRYLDNQRTFAITPDRSPRPGGTPSPPPHMQPRSPRTPRRPWPVSDHQGGHRPPRPTRHGAW